MFIRKSTVSLPVSDYDWLFFFLRTSKVVPACHISPSSRHFRRWYAHVPFFSMDKIYVTILPLEGPNVNESVTKNQNWSPQWWDLFQRPPKKIQPWIWIYQDFPPSKRCHESHMNQPINHQPSTRCHPRFPTDQNIPAGCSCVAGFSGSITKSIKDPRLGSLNYRKAGGCWLSG